jgi:hypothetical protein
MLIEFYNSENNNLLFKDQTEDRNIPMVGDQIEYQITGRLKFYGKVVSRKLVYDLNNRYTQPRIYLSGVLYA